MHDAFANPILDPILASINGVLEMPNAPWARRIRAVSAACTIFPLGIGALVLAGYPIATAPVTPEQQVWITGTIALAGSMLFGGAQYRVRSVVADFKETCATLNGNLCAVLRFKTPEERVVIGRQLSTHPKVTAIQKRLPDVYAAALELIQVVSTEPTNETLHSK